VDLFDFKIVNYALLLHTIVPAIINGGVFVYAAFFLTPNKTNWSFSMFVLLLVLVQLTEGFFEMSATPEAAANWNRMGMCIWLFVTPFGVLFTTRFIKIDRRIHNSLLHILLFLPAAILGLLLVAHSDAQVIVHSDVWNWVANPLPTPFMKITYFWITANGVVILGLLWNSYFRGSKQPNHKTQALLLAIGFSVPFIAGVFSEIVFPLYFGYENVPVIPTTITFFSIATVVAIRKYRLFNYSPKHQWNHIVEKLSEGVVIVDNNNAVMYANKTFCAALGYTFSEIKGKHAGELLALDPNQIDYIQNAVNSRDRYRSVPTEIQMKNAKGKGVWMLVSGSPYLDRSGNVIGSIAIHTNIDAQKKTESELRKSEELLVETSEELETYIYKSSHDMHAPLSSMLGIFQISKSDVKDPMALRYLNMLEEQTKKLETIRAKFVKAMRIKDVSAFTDTIYPEILVDEIVSEFQEPIAEQKIKIETHIESGVKFYSSQFILHVILRNLLDNAIRYQRNKCLDPTVAISVRAKKHFVEISISDNGMGIDPLVQSKVFDMYYRGSVISKGSGLGLYLVKKGVDKLKGEIEMKSRLGQGSEFIVRFNENSLLAVAEEASIALPAAVGQN